ncbi:jg363 [Pararge aegeria aegeria]|uniref:Jg363 protein n=1 Tax=Pararge aegeria aegeria TaxID=348720 RepID=A0A8S4QPC4_9NEOP|nr:jg363 [Pararge aegeria aegeria]
MKEELRRKKEIRSRKQGYIHSLADIKVAVGGKRISGRKDGRSVAADPPQCIDESKGVTERRLDASATKTLAFLNPCEVTLSSTGLPVV